MSTELVIKIIEVIGVIAFAVSGAMVAIKKRVDLFGVIVCSLVTAIGGGIVRDVILGVLPPKIFFDYDYVLISIATALFVFFIAFFGKERYEQKTSAALDNINNVFDALGLGVFVVLGSRAAIDAGFSDNGFLVLFLGLLTGIGGGLLRDIMVQEIPFVLKKRIYAIAALIGGIVYYSLFSLGVNYAVSAFCGIAATFVLRILATHFEWDLPVAY